MNEKEKQARPSAREISEGEKEEFLLRRTFSKKGKALSSEEVEMAFKTISEIFFGLEIGNKKECWEWNGKLTAYGYGEIKAHFNAKIVAVSTHRFSYFLFKGNLKNLIVRHTCDNRKCCNPNHLILGTQVDNIHDMLERGRHGGASKTHCKRGHEFNEENTYYRRDKVRHWRMRQCKACSRILSRKYYQAKKLQ